MTTPVPPPTMAAPQPAPAAAAPPPDEDNIAAEVAVVLAGAVLTAAAVERLVALLKLLRVKRRFVTLTVRIVNRSPLREKFGRGLVSRDNARQSALRRAQFVIASARRLQQAAEQARSRGETTSSPGPGVEPALPGRPSHAERDAVVAAAKAEARYWEQHKQAEQRREQAARELDTAAAAHGTVLEWRSKRDGRVTRACAVADGHIFDVRNQPRIGLPGMGGPHHGCRCKPVKVRRRAGQTTVDAALNAAGITGLE